MERSLINARAQKWPQENVMLQVGFVVHTLGSIMLKNLKPKNWQGVHQESESELMINLKIHTDDRPESLMSEINNFCRRLCCFKDPYVGLVVRVCLMVYVCQSYGTLWICRS